MKSSTLFERPLRAEQPLDVHAAQRGRVQAVAELLRPDVAHQVRRGVRVPVDVAVEAGHALARLQRAPVVGGVELLLRERRQQQPQALQLLRVQDAVEQSGNSCSVRPPALATRRPGRAGWSGRSAAETPAENGRQIEIQIEPRQVAVLLLLDLVDVILGERASRLRHDSGAAGAETPSARAPWSRISSGVMAASSSHDFTPAGNFTRTPSCTALPRDMVTPLAGRSLRSYRSCKSAACRVRWPASPPPSGRPPCRTPPDDHRRVAVGNLVLAPKPRPAPHRPRPLRL